MDISSKNYKKETIGIRQPSKILDQDVKLIFIYPILCDRSLNKYTDDIRKFFSVNILKEIFINNSFNLITMASNFNNSNYEYKKDTNKNFYKDFYKSNNDYYSNSNMIYNQSNINSEELKMKVREKTAVIEKLLLMDPKYKSLLPYMELITLNNMFDVPVIVGTKKMDISTTNILLTFLLSIGLKLPLNSMDNLKTIYQKLKTTSPNNFTSYLNNLVIELDSKEKSQKSIEKIRDIFFKPFNLVLKPFKYVASYFGSKQKIDDSYKDKLVKNFEYNDSLLILNSIKDELDEGLLNWKFMLDDYFLKDRLNIPENKKEISALIINNEKSNQIINEISKKFIETFIEMSDDVGQKIIFSFYNLIKPVGDFALDINGIYKEKTNDFLNKFKDIIDNDFAIALTTSLKEKNDIDELKTIIDTFANNCENNSKKLHDIFKTFRESTDKNIINIVYDANDFIKFGSFMQKYTNTLVNMSKRYSELIADILGASQYKAIDIKVINLIDRYVDNLFNDVLNRLNIATFEPALKNALLNSSFFRERKEEETELSYNNEINKEFNSIFTNLKKDIIIQIKETYRFFFYINLYLVICEYAERIQVDVEIGELSAVEKPNYILVVPLKIVETLYVALISENWKNLLINNFKDNTISHEIIRDTDASDNYVKGVVNYIQKRIKVPNLFVIDEETDTVYYKVMYQNSINKSKLSTLKSFIDGTVNKNMNDSRGY